MKRFLMLGLTSVLFLGLSLPLQGASDKPKRGGTLTMAVRKEIRIMNPLVRTRSIDGWIRELMFETLVEMDMNGNLHPNLAESWDISNDRKLYTFKIRKGVKFSDGREMTAEDVKFAMDYTMNPKNGATGFSRLAIVKRIEVPDKYTLKVYMKRSSAAFVDGLAENKAFSVIPKGSVEEGIRKPANFPPGTGPWKFVEWKPQRRMVFERNDNYWGHKPYLDKLVFVPIANDIVRLIAVRAGDVDIAERVSEEWARQIIDGKVKGVKVAESPSGGFRQIKFNVADPPFDNIKLRQAVAYAINKKEILGAGWFGFGETSNQRYPKGHSWYIEGVPSPSQNLNKAKALLKESGYKGEFIKLLVENITSSYNEAIAIQAQLKKIGLNIHIDSLESGAASAIKSEGKYSINNSGGRAIFADPSAAYMMFRCERTRMRGENETGYCDKAMDSLLEQAESETDTKKRRNVFKQIVTKLNQEVPTIHVGYIPRFYVFRDHVKGFASHGDGSFRWWRGGVDYVWLN